MKKYEFFVINLIMKKMLIFIVLIITSCGVILDPLRILGEWKLDEVEFYVYNEVLDSIKTYTGIDDNSPDTKHPIIGAFFCGGKAAYTIEFEKASPKNRLIIIGDDDDASTDDIIVDLDDGVWSIDTFENSLTIKIDGDNINSNFWEKGFTIKNYWPMANYDSLELYIEAKDVYKNKDTFTIDLSDDTIEVHSMKGIFKRGT
ncbi:MAG: hypothetical protein KAT05_04095 [Spirochaetes bacterium]|nr:hypothetical protein [Spirochaetota bacterium]